MWIIARDLESVLLMDKKHRVTLGDAVNKMTADELEYKGLTHYKENVVSYLNS